MNIKQAMEISTKAKEAGYAIAVKDGKVQFQTVLYKEDGTSDVTEHSDWLDYEEAMEIIKQ